VRSPARPAGPGHRRVTARRPVAVPVPLTAGYRALRRRRLVDVPIQVVIEMATRRMREVCEQ